MTNVVLHAGTAFSVRLGHDPAVPGRVRCEVHDGSPVLPRLRHHSSRATTGRGIRLLEAVSDRWARARGGGKTVWFEVEADSTAGSSGEDADDVEMLMRAFEDAVPPPPPPAGGVGTVSGAVHVVGRWNDTVAASARRPAPRSS